MTNGEKIKEIFPSTDSRLDERTGIMLVKWVDGATKCFKADWWNAEYKESTNKNDLRIAYISKKSVIDELKRYFHDEYYQRTSIQDCRDCFIEDVLIHLPSVTPQEPRKGHWIKQTLSVKPFGEDTVLCDQCAFMTDKDNTYNFCPNCGAKMVEPQESEDKE